MAIKIQELAADLESTFWDCVNKDPVDHFFFTYDWRLYKDDTKILLAIETNEIVGMMLVFRDSIVQLRGDTDAGKELLQHLELRKGQIMAPQEFESIVLERYEPRAEYEMVLMNLERAWHRSPKLQETVRPGEGEAKEIAALMRRSFPDWWGNMTEQRVQESMKENSWLAIKSHDKIVSVGSARLLDFGSVIGVVATAEGFRCRGFATSIVSSLLEEIFETSERALIFVLANNHSAINVYRRVGFRHFKSYLLVKVGDA